MPVLCNVIRLTIFTANELRQCVKGTVVYKKEGYDGCNKFFNAVLNLFEVNGYCRLFSLSGQAKLHSTCLLSRYFLKGVTQVDFFITHFAFQIPEFWSCQAPAHSRLTSLYLLASRVRV